MTAVKASTPGNGPLAEALYAEAESLLLNKPCKSGNVTKYRTVVKPLRDAESETIIARAVDNETGFFIELSAVFDKTDKTKAVTGPFMNYGKLYVSESKNPQLSNSQAKIWR